MTGGFQGLCPAQLRAHAEGAGQAPPRAGPAVRGSPCSARRRSLQLRSHACHQELQGVPAGAGQYRLRLRRFRIRYDIVNREVVLLDVSLRRENT